MSKKKAGEIIDEVQELVDDAQELLDDMDAPDGIVVPGTVIESLLVCNDTHNRTGVNAVCEQIRQMAQEQMPEKFKKQV